MVKKRIGAAASLTGRSLVWTLALLMLALPGCATLRGADSEDPVIDGEDVTDPGGLDDESLDDEDVDMDPPEDESAAVFDDPEPFVGATVTVRGAVNEVVDQNAFEIAPEGGGDVGFLILTPDDTVAINDLVEVTGTVRRSDFEELAAELDFELDEDLYSPTDRQFVIVADSVEVLDPAPGRPNSTTSTTT